MLDAGLDLGAVGAVVSGSGPGAGPRLLALAGAVVLVLGAVVVRSRLDDGDGGAGSRSAGDLVVVCPPDLGDVCEATLGDYEVRVEEPVATRDALHHDLGPIPAKVNELAGKHGIAPATVAKHIVLLAVHAPGCPDWNRAIGEVGRP